ncbi:MAG: radical SAM protein [Nitrospirae bacterium]|nr:radical SAM protein [Nitrospirota bacterium]
MRIIHLSIKGEQARVDFAGCNLKCPYCVHIHQPAIIKSIQEIVEFIKNSRAKEVYLGGAEPTIQKELPELINALHAMPIKIILKTSGSKPDILELVFDKVDGFIIEIKAPFGDPDVMMELTGLSRERSEQYIQNLKRSISIAKIKWLRIWIRVIPEYINTITLPSILNEISGASEVMLYQFLSNPEFDIAFKEYNKPVPAWEELEKMSELILEDIPKVIIVGENGKKVLTK